MIKIDLWVNSDFTVKLLINTGITRKLDFKGNRHHKEKPQICSVRWEGSGITTNLYQHALSWEAL